MKLPAKCDKCKCNLDSTDWYRLSIEGDDDSKCNLFYFCPKCINEIKEKIFEEVGWYNENIVHNIRWTDKVYLDSQGNIRTMDGCPTDQKLSTTCVTCDHFGNGCNKCEHDTEE